jgi:hypothetical protein
VDRDHLGAVGEQPLDGEEWGEFGDTRQHVVGGQERRTPALELGEAAPVARAFE